MVSSRCHLACLHVSELLANQYLDLEFDQIKMWYFWQDHFIDGGMYFHHEEQNVWLSLYDIMIIIP